MLASIRYWLFLAGKVAISLAFVRALLWFLKRIWDPHTAYFGYDLPYTTALGGVFLLACGLVYLAVLDQRYRCRTCLRRLRMPVETGSWSHMLQMGRPRIEYICAYGHGQLNVEEIQFTGIERPKWKEHADMWEELFRL